MAVYSYIFDNGLQLTITTSDTLTTVSGTSPSASGYAITGISGSINGESITGLNGPGGTFDPNFNADNTIFPNDSSGNYGSSLDGIDPSGIAFDTATYTYNIYSNTSPPFELDQFLLNDPTTVVGSSFPNVVTYTAACFCSGTRINTGTADLPVEALRAGMTLPTLFGGQSRIVWIGHRTVNCALHPEPNAVWPVKIAKGAFAAGLPVADLFLSPDHAIMTDGVLIPIRYLVNGRSIVQVPRDTVTYWHIELETHDVLLAEGIPCESYLDTGNRGAFANGGPPIQIHPDFALMIWDALSVAPLVTHGPRLSEARGLFLARASAMGHQRTTEPNLRIIADGVALPFDVTASRIWCDIPTHAREIRLVSRAAVPAHVRHDTDDHRSLGIAISDLKIDGHPIAAHALRAADGWHEQENDANQDAYRWTNGHALVPNAGGGRLEFNLVTSAIYWRDDEDQPYELLQAS